MEYVIIRTDQVRLSAAWVEKRIMENIQDMLGITAASLDDFSPTLMAFERKTEGVAKKLRDAVKNDNVLFNYLSNSVFSQIGEALVGKRLKMHGVVRFRTVIGFQDFTVSRPHQDNVLWPEDRNEINFWLPLCDIGEMNAPLLVYPGTGRDNYPHRPSEYGLPEIPPEAMPGRLPVALPVKKGEVIAFLPNLVHHSDKMQDNGVRFSLDFRYSVLG
jgi:ectoine hydroxylase-related dioxygenase (phytanoyl-CoA dioxygenase family)